MINEQQREILAGLNPAQREAVINYSSPSLIVAGAGSGKTRVLTCRIAYMLTDGVKPWSVLALTFTNKAAKEMRERITSMVGDRSRYIWMGTFHSIFARILYAQAPLIGYQPSFTIYDQQQCTTLIKQIIKEMDLSDETYKPRDIQARISLAKNNLVTAESYEANASLVGEDRERRRPEFATIYKTYSARCKANNAMDFDDLLLNMNILLRDHPDVCEQYSQQFEYILVDEYQDTNYAQYLILRRLSQNNSQICVVGDDAQSIYSFRGAKIENILRFRSDFKNAQTFKLEQNYRSTRNIVDAANSVIAKNQNRINKTVFSENDQGDKIRIVRTYTDGEEAQMVADGIKSCRSATSCRWSDVAVLYRTNAQSRSIEEALRRRNVPYRIYGGHSFYERKEIRDLLAYFKVIVNPRDNESLKRIINYPARGIGDVTVGRIAALAEQSGVSMWEVIVALPEHPDWQKIVGKRAVEFAKLIGSLAAEREGVTLYQFGMQVAVRSGILGLYKSDPSPESQNALDNIEELLNSMQNIESVVARSVPDDEQPAPPTLEEWLQNISLLTDADRSEEGDDERVTLMTIHASKGLEFDTVYIVGMEENLFPSLLTIASPVQLEEERRLFYVALTRAKSRVVLSYAQMRFKWGNSEMCRPSRFLDDIDAQYVDSDLDSDSDRDEQKSEAKSRFDRFAELKERYDSRSGGSASIRNTSITTNNSTPHSVSDTARQNTIDPSRLTSLGARRTPAQSVGEGSVAAANYAVGQRVHHSRFGEGQITEIEKIAADLKITVIFADEEFGRKCLLGRFAKLEILD